MLSLMTRLSLSIETNPDTKCDEWTGHKYPNGYGQITIDGKSHYVHRVVYALIYGDIPDGMVIRHTCDNRACANPEHLLLGTQGDNIKDMIDRGRKWRGREGWAT